MGPSLDHVDHLGDSYAPIIRELVGKFEGEVARLKEAVRGGGGGGGRKKMVVEELGSMEDLRGIQEAVFAVEGKVKEVAQKFKVRPC